MPKLKDEDFKTICANEILESLGWIGDEPVHLREKAWKYYLCKPRGDEAVGRSSIISADLADMTNAILAQITPMISGDDVVQFEPMSQQDEEQAKLESHACNKIFERSGGYVELQEALKSGLLEGNAWLKVCVDDKKTIQKVRLPEEPSEEQWRGLLYSEDPQEMREKTGKKSMRITTTKRRFTVESIVPGNVLWNREADTMDVQECRFIAERMMLTRSDLIERGIDPKIVEDLPATTEDTKTDSTARKRTYDNTQEAQTADQDLIEVFDCYVLVDADDTGISTRWRVMVQGEGHTFLEREEVEFVPYATGAPYIHPHRMWGESLAEHMFSIQDAKTDALRQYIDNVRVANAARVVVVEDQVEIDDVLNSRPGGVIRADALDSVVPLPFNDVSAASQGLLEYMDKIRTERGGAALDMLSADHQLVGETAHGIERQYASRELMVSMIAKNFSETLIRHTYLLLHRTLRAFSVEPMLVRMSGQWIEQDPTQWQPRDTVNVMVGLSAGQRGHVQAVLSQWLQMQAMALQAGMTIADPGTVYQTVISILQHGGIDNPDRYVIDPASPTGQQLAQAAQQAQQAQQQAQMELVQRQEALEQAKLQVDRYKHDTEIEWKYYDTAVDADLKEAEMVVDAKTKLKTADKQAQAAKANRGPSGSNGASR